MLSVRLPLASPLLALKLTLLPAFSPLDPGQFVLEPNLDPFGTEVDVTWNTKSVHQSLPNPWPLLLAASQPASLSADTRLSTGGDMQRPNTGPANVVSAVCEPLNLPQPFCALPTAKSDTGHAP